MWVRRCAKPRARAKGAKERRAQRRARAGAIEKENARGTTEKEWESRSIAWGSDRSSSFEARQRTSEQQRNGTAVVRIHAISVFFQRAELVKTSLFSTQVRVRRTCTENCVSSFRIWRSDSCVLIFFTAAGDVISVRPISKARREPSSLEALPRFQSRFRLRRIHVVCIDERVSTCLDSSRRSNGRGCYLFFGSVDFHAAESRAHSKHYRAFIVLRDFGVRASCSCLENRK